MELRFSVILSADYHIGAGFGIGSQVDSALLRDGDGVPVLRGTTVAGLLRDGMRRLLQTTPRLQDRFLPHRHAEFQGRRRDAEGDEQDRVATAWCRGEKVCPLCRIFGTPATPKRWRIGSARPAAAEQGRQGGYQAGGHAAARVRIDPRTRRALPRALFSQEEGDGRLHFIFTVDCDGEGEAERDEAALVFAAARMVRRLGSARRRGRGECAFHLMKPDGSVDHEAEARWLERFRTAWLVGDPKPRTVPETLPWTRDLDDQVDSLRFRVILRTEEPVLIAARAEAGNMFNSCGYISGTTLWGALAQTGAAQWRLRQQEDERDPDFYPGKPAFKAFQQLFLRDRIRISPLYPAHYIPGTGHGLLYAMIPAPLDLLTCKGFPGFCTSEYDTEHHGAHGYAASEDVVPKGCPKCDAPLEAPGGFLPMQSRPRFLDGARFRDELHPRIHPRNQRAATGNLYGYVALDGGQYFVGDLWCGNRTVWEALCALTGVLAEDRVVSLRLGKATRRGYGRISLWLRQLEESESAPWYGVPLEQRVENPDDPIVLTLLTDTILPDPWGRFRQTLADVNWLEDLLNGTDVQRSFRVVHGDQNLPWLRAFCRAGTVDGFNNHLGLPRWRDLALSAGSALGFRLEPVSGERDAAWFKKLQARLRMLEETGIGLRRNEGFGRVAFNHPVYRACEGLYGTGIELSKEMTLRTGPPAGPAADIAKDRRIVEDWESDLAWELDRELFEHWRWAGFAIWLYTHGAYADSLETLQQWLEEFGESKHLTATQRDKDNWYQKGEGKKGMETLQGLVKDAFERAEAGSDPKGVCRLLLERLADHLAAAVEQEE